MRCSAAFQLKITKKKNELYIKYKNYERNADHLYLLRKKKKLLRVGLRPATKFQVEFLFQKSKPKKNKEKIVDEKQ